MNNIKFLLGLDPSFTTFGAAVINLETGRRYLNTDNFQNTMKWISKKCDLKRTVCIAENPSLNTNVFRSWQEMEREIKLVMARKTSMASVKSKFLILQKKAQGVGKSGASAQLAIQLLAKNNVPIIEISPSERQRADTAQKKMKGKAKVRMKTLRLPTKTTKEQFLELTGYSGQSTEHDRDAYVLIHDVKIPWIEMKLKIQEHENKKKPSSYPRTANNNEYLFKRR